MSKTITVEKRVTEKMRQAAIAYWTSLHPRSVLIPVGEINGIIYAALEAEDPWDRNADE